MDTVESQQKSLKFDPHHPKTPELMVTKICMSEYIPEIYSDETFHYNLVSKFCPPTYPKLLTKSTPSTV